MYTSKMLKNIKTKGNQFMTQIINTKYNIVKEQLKKPFGFKGNYVTELWNIVVKVESEDNFGIGLGVLSPLWSDANIFLKYGQTRANDLMIKIIEYALKKVKYITFENPIEIFDKIYKDVYVYAKSIIKTKSLSKTFVLNSLVAIDNAIWQLYSFENNISDFDKMIPKEYRFALTKKHNQMVSIPLISYDVSINEVIHFVKQGSFFLKIKIGADPDKDGSTEKMIEWDKNRIYKIHEAIKDIKTPYTQSKHVVYYLDANGRYKNKKDLMKLIDYLKEIDALKRVIVLEEPFDESYLENVNDIPVRLASDESAHSEIDVIKRIKLGYKAIALKPIAKTLSMTLKMLKEATNREIPCFCADLTVNPVMVDWNKNIAARIGLLPEISIGVLESNGEQNYTNWDKMLKYHPIKDGKWIKPNNGIYNLDEQFYKQSGGIFLNSIYYLNLVK